MSKYREWPFIEAEKLLTRLEKQGKSSALFETGYGPSGLPHIGTFGEVARTSFVVEALRILNPSVSAKLITFSDDMDGLRSVPDNIPQQEMLKEMLGRPLNSIPDPFGNSESFSANMNSRLQTFLESFGFDFSFISATDAYGSGRLNEGLTRIMRNHDKIISVFTATIAEEKRARWSPFIPICEQCGRMYTTLVTEHDVDRYEVAYSCSNAENPEMIPCGYTGKTSIFNGKVKVGWKIDWALRWFALGIDYEMYGKDLIDSVVVSNKVIRYIGGRPPLSYKYELFLDEEGKKVSKKLGNGVSIEEWLRYAPSDVLLYFMYVKPNKPKKMALPLIAKAVDEYRERLFRYRGEVDSAIRLIKAREITDGNLQVPASDLDYGLICNLVSTLNARSPDVVMQYLERYDPKIREDEDFFRKLVSKAIVYNQEVLIPRRKPFTIDHSFDPFLRQFRDEIEGLAENGGATPDAIQSISFGVARKNGLVFGDWFRFLYEVLLSQERGPKVGSFICLYGVPETIAKIDTYLERVSDD